MLYNEYANNYEDRTFQMSSCFCPPARHMLRGTAYAHVIDSTL